jgi:hypothetical protein
MRRREAILLTLTGLLLIGSGVGGVMARGWCWQASEPVRFVWDIRNGMNWGGRVVDWGHEASEVAAADALPWGDFFGGYRGAYDRVLGRWDGDGPVGLDYAPLRLLVMSSWMADLRRDDSAVRRGEHYTDDRAGPMRLFNLGMESTAALALFGLVADWLRRCGNSRPGSLLGGSVAAGLFFLNPALILNAHGWPQWDVWLLPYFITAVWATTRQQWLAAGVLIGVGAMLKGQLLLLVPTLAVFAIFVGGWRPVVGLVGGWMLSWTVISAPWTFETTAAKWLTLLVLLPIGLIVWRPKLWPVWAALVGPTLLLGGWLGGGSFGWLTVGFLAPTDQYPQMAPGPMSNFPAVLHEMFGVERDTPWLGLETRHWLMLIIAAASLLAGVLAATYWRRREPRFLVAITVVWLMIPAFLPQMHERYFLWPAVLSAVWAVLSLHGLLLHITITAIALLTAGTQMLRQNDEWSGSWLGFAEAVHPEIGWGVAVVALVGLFHAIGPVGSGLARRRDVEPLGRIGP